jgi:hypothetical protein
VTAQLRADEHVDGLTAEAFDLTGGEPYDPMGIEQHEDTRDRGKQVGVDTEDIRSGVDRSSHS